MAIPPMPLVPRLQFFSVTLSRRPFFFQVRSVFKALARHQSLAEVSLLRGRRILELEWRRGI